MRQGFESAVQAIAGVIAGILCAIIGGFIGFLTYRGNGGEFAGLGEAICGAIFGYAVGVPAGVWLMSRLLNRRGFGVVLGIVLSFLLSLVLVWVRLLEWT